MSASRERELTATIPVSIVVSVVGGGKRKGETRTRWLYVHILATYARRNQCALALANLPRYSPLGFSPRLFYLARLSHPSPRPHARPDRRRGIEGASAEKKEADASELPREFVTRRVLAERLRAFQECICAVCQCRRGW